MAAPARANREVEDEPAGSDLLVEPDDGVRLGAESVIRDANPRPWTPLAFTFFVVTRMAELSDAVLIVEAIGEKTLLGRGVRQPPIAITPRAAGERDSP